MKCTSESHSTVKPKLAGTTLRLGYTSVVGVVRHEKCSMPVAGPPATPPGSTPYSSIQQTAKVRSVELLQQPATANQNGGAVFPKFFASVMYIGRQSIFTYLIKTFRMGLVGCTCKC